MKKTFAAISLSVASTASFAYTAGDLAIISYNGDRDGISLVALTDIAPNSTFFIRDDEWNGTAFADALESTFRWTTGPSTLAAGTVVSFGLSGTTAATAAVAFDSPPGAMGGAVSYVNVINPGYNNSDDTVYLYETSTNVWNTGTITFIGAVSIGGFGVNGSLTGTGLTAGVNATSGPSSADFTEYTGPRSGELSFSSYLPVIANASNWSNGGNGVFNTTLPIQTNFTITPIPEASEISMMLAGLGLIGAIARRRNRA